MPMGAYHNPSLGLARGQRCLTRYPSCYRHHLSAQRNAQRNAACLPVGVMPPTALGPTTTSPQATCLARRYVHSYVRIRFYLLTAPFVAPCSHVHLWQPLAPGEKRKKEEWENIWYVGMYGSMLLAGVLLYYKPDTRYARFYTVYALTTHSGLQLVDMGVQRSKAKDGGARGEDRLSLIYICTCFSQASIVLRNQISYYCVHSALREAVTVLGNYLPSQTQGYGS